MKNKQICRRRFLKTTTGYLFLSAVVIAPGLISLRNYKNRKKGQLNTQPNPCQQCPLLSECDLPEAVLFKKTASSAQ
jgi:hypothetical protein